MCMRKHCGILIIVETRGRKPVSKRNIDHRALSIERGQIPFDGDSPKHTGIHLDTSKLTEEEVNSNPLYWRERIRRARGVAFDDTAKVAFLDALRLYGKVVIACRETGIHRDTVMRHREKDDEFACAFDLMLELHAMDVVNRLETEALNGFHNNVFNAKTGEIIGTKITYETPLRVALLKRFDPEYKDRAQVDMNVGGKVIAVPPEMSNEEWDAAAEAALDRMRQVAKEREAEEALEE